MPNTIQENETVAQQSVANKDLRDIFNGLISAIVAMNDWTLSPGKFQKRNEKDGSIILRAEFVDNSKNKKEGKTIPVEMRRDLNGNLTYRKVGFLLNGRWKPVNLEDFNALDSSVRQNSIRKAATLNGSYVSSQPNPSKERVTPRPTSTIITKSERSEKRNKKTQITRL